MTTVANLEPGQSAVLPDGSLVTRRFDGGLRVRGLNSTNPPDTDPVVMDPTTRDRDLRMRGILTENRAAGHDVTPGHDELHHYWTKGEGLAKWAKSEHPWTTLVAHLTKHVGPERAKVFASRWFHEVFGFYAGSDLNRVTHGKPPRGDVVGPG